MVSIREWNPFYIYNIERDIVDDKTALKNV